jgi:hypothetical protein
MISDSDLLLYHYGDGLDAAERDRIRAALSAQPQLARRLRSIVEQLDTAATMPSAPVPAHIQQRWQAAIEEAARNEAALAKRLRPVVYLSRWRAVGVTATIVLVIVIGVRLGMQSARDDLSQDRSPGSSEVATNIASSERGLRWHLASAEQQLAELDAASGEERDRLIDTVIGQNRLYAIAAERSGDQRLARALRSFTPILERLADDSGASGELAQLNFELRVMQARLATQSATSPTPQSLAL